MIAKLDAYGYRYTTLKLICSYLSIFALSFSKEFDSKQFSIGTATYPPSTHLIALVKDAGIYDEYKGILTRLDKTCDTCLSMKRKPPRPVVSLPIATECNEVVVLDLKEWEKGKKWILHIVDAATRFTLSAFITDKKPATIINRIMLLWIGSVFGSQKRSMADNCGDFANEKHKDMC